MTKKHFINKVNISLSVVAILLGVVFAIFLQTAQVQAATNCSSSSDVNCVQSDGKYRCWDGSSIAMTPGVTCPENPNDNGSSNSQTSCDITGGNWTAGTSSTSGTCICPGGGVFSLNDGCPVNENGSTNIESAKVPTDCNDQELTRENCKIINILANGINFLSAVAGMSIVASIMIAGYQYMTARDNSGLVEAAKKRIMWSVVALVLFIFMYSILNFVVPGGVL